MFTCLMAASSRLTSRGLLWADRMSSPADRQVDRQTACHLFEFPIS